MSNLSKFNEELKGLQSSIPESVKDKREEIVSLHSSMPTGKNTANLALKTDSEGKIAETYTDLHKTYGVNVSLSFEVHSPQGVFPSVEARSVDSNGETVSQHAWSNIQQGSKSSTKSFHTSFWYETKFGVSGDAGQSHANSTIMATVFYSY